ncbi:MAG: hypothetical protein WCS91_03905 [Bacilli bacterium]
MKKKSKLLLLLPCLYLLTSCDTSAISEPISDTISNALPNLWVSLAQLGAFGVTLFVFFRFAYKPLKNKMKQRSDAITKAREEAKSDSEKAKEANRIAESNIEASRKKANEIVQDAKKNGEKLTAEMKDKAQLEIEEQRKQNEEDMALRRKKLESEDHNMIVRTALNASKLILGRELTKEDNDKIVDSFIDSMKKEESQKDSSDSAK